MTERELADLRKRLERLVKKWRRNAYESSDEPYCAGLGEAADDVEKVLARWEAGQP